MKKEFYVVWNKVKFWMNDIDFGEGMQVYTKVYLSKHPDSRMSIGRNFTLSSGEFFNPLCRNIRAGIFLEKSSVIEIGDNSGFSSPCIRAGAGERITIGNNVMIGGDCILMGTDAHSLDYLVRRAEEKSGRDSLMSKIFRHSGVKSKDLSTVKTAPIVIEDDVLIGTRCIILKGVTIGARSVIGAGSIVTKSIPPDSIAAGNPCKVIRNIC